MDFELIPLLRDNYAHLLIHSASARAVVIDPSEAEPVLSLLEARGLRLEAVWNTHHHWDHTGGNAALAEATGCAVVGAAADEHRIPALTMPVGEGDTVRFADFTATVVVNPGHTSGAISFVGGGRAYTGDTLFTAGCGRLFEGTPETMWASLQRLAALPGDTLICCGHEYTEANLRFAAWAEPDNAAVAARLERARGLRAAGEATVPERLSEELATNPFLRATEPALLASLAAHHGVELAPGAATFAWLRAAKDDF